MAKTWEIACVFRKSIKFPCLWQVAQKCVGGLGPGICPIEMGQAEMPDIKPILEVNGEHSIVLKLKDTEDEARIADIAGVLLDQALLVEGVKLKDPSDFVKRLNRLLV